MVEAQKPHRVIYIGGKLECRDAVGDELETRTNAAGLQDGAVQRHVDMRGAFHPADLVSELACIGHRMRHVVRHVEAGRHATRRGTARSTFDARPANRRGSVHVPIDQSRQDQPATMIERVRRRRWRALADRRYDLVPQHAVGTDKIADHHAVACVRHLYIVSCDHAWHKHRVWLCRAPARLPLRRRDRTKGAQRLARATRTPTGGWS
jgi:hypothetical protein